MFPPPPNSLPLVPSPFLGSLVRPFPVPSLQVPPPSFVFLPGPAPAPVLFLIPGGETFGPTSGPLSPALSPTPTLRPGRNKEAAWFPASSPTAGPFQAVGRAAQGKNDVTVGKGWSQMGQSPGTWGPHQQAMRQMADFSFQQCPWATGEAFSIHLSGPQFSHV